jgi:hypothetical protein
MDAPPSESPSALALEGVGLPSAAAAQLVAAAGGALDPDQIERACRVLVEVAGVPVSSLRHVLIRAPEILAVPAASLEQQYDVLLEAWLDERQLRAAVRAHPAILTHAFTANLKRCLATLEEMGFTKVAALAWGLPVHRKLHF